MTDEIDIFFERLLPDTLERFLDETLGEAIPRRGVEGRYRVLAAGRFSGRIVGDLLMYARNQELDAAFVLVEKDVLRTLYFSCGLAIGADSNVIFERLGRILGNADIVSEEEADTLVEIEEREGVAAAAARISPEAVHWGLERRIWEVACGLYYMPRAHYLLVDGEPDLGDLPRFLIPPMDLAMEGLRRYDEWRHRKTVPAPPASPSTPPPPAKRKDPLRREINDLMREVLK
ncbi:MAG: DUF4388 domain-containing protein [Planctomycetota bacterium]